MQTQHQKAEHVFPEKRLGKQPLVKHHFFPNRACDHDGVEHQGFEHHRPDRQHFAFACDHEAGDQAYAHAKHDELKSSQKTLYRRPNGVVAAHALLGAVQARADDGVGGDFVHGGKLF